MRDDVTDRVEDSTCICQAATASGRTGDIHSVIVKAESAIERLEKEAEAIEARLRRAKRLPSPLPDPHAGERALLAQLREERDRYQSLRDLIRKETGF